jgi:integrase
MPRHQTATLLVVERDTDPSTTPSGVRKASRSSDAGPAWIERGDQARAGERRRTRHTGWIKRRGRPAEGHLSEDTALALIPSVLVDYDAERTQKQEQQEREKDRVVSFDEIAEGWLRHRISIIRIKRTTLNHYRAMLLSPDQEPKKRGRAPRARIMARFGGRPAASITTREIAAWLQELDRDPLLSPRSVNQHRQLLCSIYSYACREDTFGLPDNPATRTEKRRESDPAEIVTYTPAEVEAITVAARTGAHRYNKLELSETEIETRCLEDEQDACLILVAAFCGLRMGECLALRWRHVMWDAQRLTSSATMYSVRRTARRAGENEACRSLTNPPRRLPASRGARCSRSLEISSSALAQTNTSMPPRCVDATRLPVTP